MGGLRSSLIGETETSQPIVAPDRWPAFETNKAIDGPGNGTDDREHCVETVAIETLSEKSRLITLHACPIFDDSDCDLSRVLYAGLRCGRNSHDDPTINHCVVRVPKHSQNIYNQ